MKCQGGQSSGPVPTQVDDSQFIAAGHGAEADSPGWDHVEAVPIHRAQYPQVRQPESCGVQAIQMTSTTTGCQGDGPSVSGFNHSTCDETVSGEDVLQPHCCYVDDRKPVWIQRDKGALAVITEDRANRCLAAGCEGEF